MARMNGWRRRRKGRKGGKDREKIWAGDLQEETRRAEREDGAWRGEEENGSRFAVRGDNEPTE